MLVVDLLLFNLSLLFSFQIRYPDLSFFDDVYYISLLMFINIDWIICTFIFGSYKVYRVSSIEKILKSTFQTIFLHILLVTAFWVFIKGYFFSRQILITTYVSFILMTLIWRMSNYYYQLYLRKIGKNLRKVIIVGYGDTAIELADFFEKNPQFGFKFEGFFDDQINNHNIRGPISNIKNFVSENKIDEIYCLVPDIEEDELNNLVEFGENNLIRVKLVPNIKSNIYTKSKVDLYGTMPILIIKEEPLDDEFNRFIKRFFDIIFSTLVILLIFPWLFIIISVLIKMESKGPILFSQNRSGRNYRSFKCLKFRTMKYQKNAEFVQATKNDKRVTKVGAFLRKTSLDELPQFFNVLIGQMSVVGPRPHPLKLDDEYKVQINKYMSRHFVKPGVTGLSQILGYRGETNEPHLMKARIKMDNFYIENWTFFLDIKIIFLTMYRVIKSDEKAF
jgi:Undecaprenyl-phosphate glucose phosphotransferase